MRYLASGKIIENMLQLTRFSVYLEGILNKNNGYCHIEIIISAAHMLRAVQDNDNDNDNDNEKFLFNIIIDYRN